MYVWSMVESGHWLGSTCVPGAIYKKNMLLEEPVSPATLEQLDQIVVVVVDDRLEKSGSQLNYQQRTGASFWLSLSVRLESNLRCKLASDSMGQVLYILSSFIFALAIVQHHHRDRERFGKKPRSSDLRQYRKATLQGAAQLVFPAGWPTLSMMPLRLFT